MRRVRIVRWVPFVAEATLDVGDGSVEAVRAAVEANDALANGTGFASCDLAECDEIEVIGDETCR